MSESKSEYGVFTGVDEVLKCKTCHGDFTFTAGEQKFFAGKGFTKKPLSCKTCRDAKKQRDSGASPRAEDEDDSGRRYYRR